MSRDSFFVPGADGSRGRVCLRGLGCLRVRVCPSGIPRRVIMLQPLGWRDCPCFDLLAASIRNFGLEIGNRCTDIPEMCHIVAAIAKSGLEIKNRCMEVPGMNLVAAAIAKSGPEIRNRCTDCPCFGLLAASIAKLTP